MTDTAHTLCASYGHNLVWLACRSYTNGYFQRCVVCEEEIGNAEEPLD